MEKAKLSREAADAIVYLKNSGWSDDQILKNAWGDRFAKQELYCLSDLPPMSLAAALVNGYEVEETPEEKIRSWHNFIKQQLSGSTGPHCGQLLHEIEIMEKTLNVLCIKIEGVNA